jgi:hypothetical protein
MTACLCARLVGCESREMFHKIQLGCFDKATMLIRDYTNLATVFRPYAGLWRLVVVFQCDSQPRLQSFISVTQTKRSKWCGLTTDSRGSKDGAFQIGFFFNTAVARSDEHMQGSESHHGS